MPDSLILNTTTEKRLLSKDILSQHLEAYFLYVYHLPGYDFLHRPSMLEDLHHNRIPPVLATAICAAVAMYVSSSAASKQLSVQWAKEIDTYIFSSLNNLNLRNLQVMILSMFQHFSYRQFGRVWLMHGMATRLALGVLLGKARSGIDGASSVVSRECAKRLAWSLFVQDKLHAGGVDEFQALPEQWMRISLPLNDDDFLRERDRRVGTLADNYATLSANGLGLNGFLVILMNLRHRLLR
jgi:hypothetical protein